MGVLVLSENGLLHHLLRQEALHHPRNLCQKSFCSIARADLLPTSPLILEQTHSLRPRNAIADRGVNHLKNKID